MKKRNRRPSARDWHRCPPKRKGCCPYCGISSRWAPGEHRKAKRSEGYSRQYLRWCPRKGATIEVGPRWTRDKPQPPKGPAPATVAIIQKAGALVEAGYSLRGAARQLGVDYNRLRDFRFRWPYLWPEPAEPAQSQPPPDVPPGTHTLEECLDAYILFRGVKRPYDLARVVALFEEWLGRPGSDCASRELCEPPGRVRRAKKPQPCPIAWTAEEVRKLVAQCRKLLGRFDNGAPRALYCEALVLFIYDTGLRRQDAWSITRSQIRPDGAIVLRQQKTGAPHYPRLRPETLALLDRLPGNRPLRCPYRMPSGSFYKFWKRHVTAPAGVRHGVLQQARRTGASHLAIEHPESVTRYLGHASPEMQRHYVDYSIGRPKHHLPPPLLGLEVAEAVEAVEQAG